MLQHYKKWKIDNLFINLVNFYQMNHLQHKYSNLYIDYQLNLEIYYSEINY